MNDLIRRQDAIDAFNGAGFCSQEYVQETISELPSAQSERLKGHWIFDFAHNEMTCSECGRTFTGGFDLDNADNFCRHCGSDNRGEQE